MAKQLFVNHEASTRLASSITSSATSLDVTAGTGAAFPALSGGDWFTVTLVSTDGTTEEIVKVTAVATDTLTVTRAREGTTAATFASGAYVKPLLTAAALTDLRADVDGKQPLDADLTAIAGLTSAANKGIQFTGSGTAGTYDLTAAGKALLDDADAAAQRTTLDVYSTSEVDSAISAASVANLDDVGDVNAPTPSNGDVLTWDSTPGEWVAAAPSGGGASRATVTKTTASLANDATENSTVALAKGGLIYNLTVDRACWIRLYQTSADRTADASRTLGTPAPTTTNILAEWSFTGSGTQRRLVVPYCNGDGSPTTDIYYAITNKSGSAHTVQVDFVHLPLET